MGNSVSSFVSRVGIALYAAITLALVIYQVFFHTDVVPIVLTPLFENKFDDPVFRAGGVVLGVVVFFGMMPGMIFWLVVIFVPLATLYFSFLILQWLVSLGTGGTILAVILIVVTIVVIVRKPRQSSGYSGGYVENERVFTLHNRKGKEVGYVTRARDYITRRR